jgi:long-chain acyl-CoA synthetase
MQEQGGVGHGGYLRVVRAFVASSIVRRRGVLRQRKVPSRLATGLDENAPTMKTSSSSASRTSAPAGAWPRAVRTLAELFAWRALETPEGEAWREFDTGAGQWCSLRWREARDAVERFGAALATHGLARGDRVALLLPNGVDQVCMDQAVLAAACVPVPMHALDNPASIAYVLADSGARLLFAHSEAQWRAVADTGVALPALECVIVQSGEAGAGGGGPPRIALQDWLARSAGAPLAAGQVPPREDELCAIVYTSGTTGRPKGVMLTHANVLANVRAVLERFEARPDDVFLSFLPLSHTFERTAGYYLPVAAGCCVAFARSVPQLMEDFGVVRPTILVSVPRIYERVYAAMQAQVAGSAARRLALRAAIAIGWRRFERAQGRASHWTPLALLDTLAWPALDPLVGAALRARFGGRLRIAVSGGAPLAPAIARCFLGLGVAIIQGYGMTETAPVVSANALEDNDPATVGRPLRGVDVRLGELQELQVHGPNVMAGYWNRPEDTAAVFVDGWLRTGDQAAIEDGRVRILGRIKEIIVTATGEKIAPADVEQAIVGDALFEQAYVVGEGHPFIACVVVLGAAGWRELAGRLGLDPEAPASLSAPAAVEAALKRIDACTNTFPRYGQPRKVVLTREPWTIENGLMTPTLKLKRRNLEARFAGEIERVYAR